MGLNKWTPKYRELRNKYFLEELKKENMGKTRKRINIEIMRLHDRGMLNKDIAEFVHMSEKYVNDIIEKNYNGLDEELFGETHGNFGGVF